MLDILIIKGGYLMTVFPEDYDDFILVAQEADLLALEGAFGDASKYLVLTRDNISTAEFLFNTIDQWIERNTTFQKETLQVTLSFFELHQQAILASAHNTLQLALSFIQGGILPQATENLSKFTDLGVLQAEIMSTVKELEQSKSVLKLKSCSNLISNAYLKNVEFMRVAFHYFYHETEIINMPTSFQLETSKFNDTLFKIITKLDKNNPHLMNTCNKYFDRNFRNSEAHFDVTYNAVENKVVWKFNRKGKVIKKKKSLEELFLSYLKVSILPTATVYSYFLLSIALLDQTLFGDIYTKVKRLGHN